MPQNQLAAPNEEGTGLWDIVDNLIGSADKIKETYDTLVDIGVITPPAGYQPPAPAPAPAPAPEEKPPIYERPWFFPVVAGIVAGGGYGVYRLAKK